MAITSTPSVADIGFSGMRRRKRISADHPVANAIGISGTAAADTRLRIARSTRNTAASPARRVRKRRPDDESLLFASAASTGMTSDPNSETTSWDAPGSKPG